MAKIDGLDKVPTEDLIALAEQIDEEIKERRQTRAREIAGKINALIDYAFENGFEVYVERVIDGTLIVRVTPID